MALNDNRLTRLLPGLTAQERATAVIEAWKDDRAYDPQLRRSMPLSQGPTVRRLLDDAGTLNAHVAWLLSLHELRLKHAWSQLGLLLLLQEEGSKYADDVAEEVSGLKTELDESWHEVAALRTRHADGESILHPDLSDSVERLYESFVLLIEACQQLGAWDPRPRHQTS